MIDPPLAIRHVEQHPIAAILGDEHRRYRQYGAFDAAFVETGEHVGRRAELHHLDIVGIHLPTLQHHQQHGMGHRADARHANSLSFQVHRRLDIRFRHESLQALIDNAGDHHGIPAAQRSGDQDIARGIDHLYVVGDQGTDAGGSALAGDNHFGIDTVLAKEPSCFRHPHRGVQPTHRAQADPQFILSNERRRGYRQAQ